jgi:hypothetical protein
MAETTKRLTAWFRRFGWFERRFFLVIGTLIVGWLVTILVMLVFKNWLFWEGGRFHEELLREILAAWTGELLFFTVIASVITIVTLKNPMQEGVEERLRIMFGQTHIPDAVLKYNKNAISRLSAYARVGTRQVMLETYDDATKCYRARVKTEYEIHNLFPDLSYSDSTTISIKNDDFGDQCPTEFGRITSIRIGSTENVTNPLIMQKEGITSDVQINIPPGDSVVFAVEYNAWLKVGKIQAMRTKRVVEQFSMVIVSQCDQNARIELDGEPRVLLYNQPVAFPLVQGVSPGERINVYTPLEPI